MGLDIGEYHASYHELHRLRQFALDVEKNKKKLMCRDYHEIENCGKCIYCALDNIKDEKEIKGITKFYEFINHSDCDGGYISFKTFGINKLPKETIGWGNLDELQKEVKELNKHKRVLKDWDLTSWEAFYRDVILARGILEFR
jgi:hypothetical protein